MRKTDSGPTVGARRQAGAQVVQEIFGQKFFDRTMGELAEGDGTLADMARLALEQCYGDVWTRPGLSRRDRSLVTLGMLLALRQPDELANHVLGAVGNGVTENELLEVALHAMPYVGFPAAGQAMSVIRQTLQDAGVSRMAARSAKTLAARP